jgi:branched-subunit amino acid aminotransferase/4-amino-4-deoxychorismate lyase
MAESTRYEFTGSRLVPVEWCMSQDERIVAADSWRVSTGSAIGLEKHLARFAEAVHTVAPDSTDRLEAFFAACLSLLPGDGEWFPRVECVAGPHGSTLRFYHRGAPDRLNDATLATVESDPRVSPTIKGPDLDRLMALRRHVAPTGATEAVILTPEGHAAEGAYSSLVAWSIDRRELWVVAEGIPRIPSVTEAVLADCVRRDGLRVVGREMTPASLDGHVVWILSALHGIRRVVSWVQGPAVDDDAAFAAHWQQSLADTSRPVADNAFWRRGNP